MPEGPQIVFLKEQTEIFIGQEVIAANGAAQHIPFDRLAGQTLTELKIFGKELLCCFSDFTIRVHLLLFGKYGINKKLNRELRLGLVFETGEINFYACDCRLIAAPLNQVYDWSTDVMSHTFDLTKALAKLYRQPKRFICEALLDQQILAGVGNGIKNEVLFRRNIHPQSLVGAIPEPELIKLIRACVTFSFEYLQWLHEGNETKKWHVYQQKICPHHHVALRREKIGKSGRSCYYCEMCQQLYLPDA